MDCPVLMNVPTHSSQCPLAADSPVPAPASYPVVRKTAVAGTAPPD